MAIMQPKFAVPQKRRVTMTRTMWVKGKGLPKSGVAIGGDGHEVTIETENGAEWYMPYWIKGAVVKIAVIPSTL